MILLPRKGLGLIMSRSDMPEESLFLGETGAAMLCWGGGGGSRLDFPSAC